MVNSGGRIHPHHRNVRVYKGVVGNVMATNHNDNSLEHYKTRNLYGFKLLRDLVMFYLAVPFRHV